MVMLRNVELTLYFGLLFVLKERLLTGQLSWYMFSGNAHFAYC